MREKSLESKAKSGLLVRTANEKAYLNSMMSEAKQEGYTCVSGCANCVSCGGNDYAPTKK